MAIMRVRHYGHQFMLSIPIDYARVWNIKAGDLYELIKIDAGLLFKKISLSQAISGNEVRDITHVEVKGAEGTD